MATNFHIRPRLRNWLGKCSYIFFVISLLSAPSYYAQTNEDCLSCHSDETLTMDRKGKPVKLFVDDKILGISVHKKLQCVSCHVGFDPGNVPHKENIQPINCQSCHKNAPVKHLFHPQMLKAAANSESKDLNCKGCHGTHDAKQIKVAGAKGTPVCANCHSAESNDFSQSTHHAAGLRGVKEAPSCLTCHVQQITTKGFANDTVKAKLAQEKLCLTCHLDDPAVRSKFSYKKGFIQSYDQSVHGRAIRDGKAKAAGCVDCHGVHKIQGADEKDASIAKKNIPATCGKCHVEIAKQYAGSVHGMSVAKGGTDAPVCTDCHGEHNILKHNDPNAAVSFKNVSEQICSKCHSSMKLSEKYGMAANKFQTFKDSYHGLALEGGSASVANCSSCHGIHDIKASSDPESRVNKKNLAKTCGKCHPGANANFAVGSVHVTVTQKDEPVLWWIVRIYLILIGLTIGGMFFHNFIDFIKKAKLKKLRQRGLLPQHHHGRSLYLRMTVGERIQHVSLMLSFFGLVFSGFMLSYPDAWWVKHIRNFVPGAFELRSIFHRICAVVMVTASLSHLFYIIFTQRGRQLVFDLLPRLKDAQDAWGVAKFNLGFSKEKPLLDRFSYVEKAEYWALIWGTIVMTATGLMMWFDNTFIGLYTKIGWDIARTVHYYEAWLAFLSIVVWHLYFVIFNPDIYPMNLAWIKGTISEEEMADEHPLELERIKQKEAEDFNKVSDDTKKDSGTN